jgi:G3E family GTPase
MQDHCIGLSAIRRLMLCRNTPAGKTTVLRHLLQNTTDLRIGCIVNDVASINVDAKLLRNDRNRGRSQQPKSTADLTDTIELANGCACELIQVRYANVASE